MNELEQYIKQRRSMVLATLVDGEVRAATTGFAVGDDLAIYFQMFRDSVKHRGIAQHRQVSLTIDDGFTVPMRGVEVIGIANIIEGAERQMAEALLTRRYPELETVWSDPRILIVRVRPERVRFTDWTHGIGHSREARVER